MFQYVDFANDVCEQMVQRCSCVDAMLHDCLSSGLTLKRKCCHFDEIYFTGDVPVLMPCFTTACHRALHWKENVVILSRFTSLEMFLCWCHASRLLVIWPYIETKMLSFWRDLLHWLHWKLSKWQLQVQLMTKMSKWQHFYFSIKPRMFNITGYRNEVIKSVEFHWLAVIDS